MGLRWNFSLSIQLIVCQTQRVYTALQWQACIVRFQGFVYNINKSKSFLFPRGAMRINSCSPWWRTWNAMLVPNCNSFLQCHYQWELSWLFLCYLVFVKDETCIACLLPGNSFKWLSHYHSKFRGRLLVGTIITLSRFRLFQVVIIIQIPTSWSPFLNIVLWFCTFTFYPLSLLNIPHEESKISHHSKCARRMLCNRILRLAPGF